MIEQLAGDWRAAQAEAARRRATLIKAIQAAAKTGTSEYELAAQAGVQRGTIREWLGK